MSLVSPHQWQLFQQQKTYPTVLLFHVTQGPLLHKARACWALTACDAVQPTLQVRGDITNIVLLPLPKPGTFGLEMWRKNGRNQKQKACQKLPRGRQWCSPRCVPWAPWKAGRAAQCRHDQPLCSKPALVGAPGWHGDSTGKPQPMATWAHQLEHPLPLHIMALACSHVLPATPQKHLHMWGNKCTLRRWPSQPLVPTACEAHADAAEPPLKHSSLFVPLWLYFPLSQRPFC